VKSGRKRVVNMLQITCEVFFVSQKLINVIMVLIFEVRSGKFNAGRMCT
jgi:hypothetical protein